VSSTNHRPTVDEIIAANGKDGITHIIEYENIFNGGTTWKLCAGKEIYEYAIVEGAFINPRLIWQKQGTKLEL
jgi:hypothetical protein